MRGGDEGRGKGRGEGVEEVAFRKTNESIKYRQDGNKLCCCCVEKSLLIIDIDILYDDWW